MSLGDVDKERLEKLLGDVKPSGGSEMSNHQLFVERLTGALGLPQPEFAREETRFNDYVFERNVTFRHAGGTSSTGRIDCYKRGCFVLEAKQSAKRQQAIAAEQLSIAGLETAQKLGHASVMSVVLPAKPDGVIARTFELSTIIQCSHLVSDLGTCMTLCHNRSQGDAR